MINFIPEVFRSKGAAWSGGRVRRSLEAGYEGAWRQSEKELRVCVRRNLLFCEAFLILYVLRLATTTDWNIRSE